MPTPRPQTYTAPHGGDVYFGMLDPAYVPSYVAAAPVNTWTLIPGTACPSQLTDYSGVAIRDESSLTEVWVGGGGGHGSGTNAKLNDTYSINLHSDNPAWVKRSGPSDPAGYNGLTAVNSIDGSPCPRHLYTDITWMPEVGLYMIGGRFGYNGDGTFGTQFGWSPVTNSWVRLANRPGDHIAYSVRDPVTGMVYATFVGTNLGCKYDPRTNVHSTFDFSGTAKLNRFGNAWDSKRGRIQHFSFGDSWTGDGFGPEPQEVVCCSVTVPGGVKTAISFNASAALTAIRAEASTSFLSSALEYNPDLDVFYVYGGWQSKNVYVITPNDLNVWDIALLPIANSSAINDMTGTALNKLRYIQKYKALFIFNADNNIAFVRTQ